MPDEAGPATCAAASAPSSRTSSCCPNRTVYDNVAYALQVIGAPRSEIRRKVPEILRLVGLQAKIHNYPDELSGGEQQRVSIARAFVNHPPLLLADEPTGNLDPETSIGIMQLLYRINRTGTTVLVVTHDREMVDKMRRRVIALEEGRLVRDEAGAGYHDESTTRVRRPRCAPRWASARPVDQRATTVIEHGPDHLLHPRGASARCAAAPRPASPRS